jgi:uncharacterized protein with NRDE domain
VRVRARFEAVLQSVHSSDPEALTTELFAMLADRETAPPDTVPPGDLTPEWARKLSAPFVLDSTYGTRCSTVLTISGSGTLRITESRFDAEGVQTGQSEHLLNGGDDR